MVRYSSNYKSVLNIRSSNVNSFFKDAEHLLSNTLRNIISVCNFKICCNSFLIIVGYFTLTVFMRALVIIIDFLALNSQNKYR
jgi:hypothetical protein